MSEQSAENGLRLSVVTITCRACGRVLSQSIPRVSEPDEIDSEAPCSPAFAEWASCPDHPAGPPDQGLRYSQDALPLMWTVRCVLPPAGGCGAADSHQTMRNREHLSVCPICNADLACPTPPGTD